MNYFATEDTSDANITLGYDLTFVICHIHIHLFYGVELGGELYDGNQPFGTDN